VKPGEFDRRYRKLNQAQKEAVDQIDGPVMVVAGPGTGKTELLSMRAANILKKTDTLPQNILCLTFTESGASAMRKRLSDIIGPDAYKVAIHTFHSFGSELINRHGEYFYNGARFQPASDINVYDILFEIFESLSYKSPLASLMNGEFTYLQDTIQVLSELKRSGVTSDELLKIIDDNERVIDSCERELAKVFMSRISKTTKDQLPPIALKVAELELRPLPPSVVPLFETLALSISHAVDEAEDTNSTKPITAWRNKWLEKDPQGNFVFKDRKRAEKLRAVGYIYHQYLSKMQEKKLFDFDDMVLEVVHALEVIDELRFNMQEQYLYIMVDEFQDTNMAQSRLLRSLTNNPASEGAPNIMVVGDDDQAIYSFQGAEISNILQFRGLYETTKFITLTDNYRSTDIVLTKARSVIQLGTERLERLIPELDKSLTAHRSDIASTVDLREFANQSAEKQWIAQDIKAKIETGLQADEITIIARRHHELVGLLPYLSDEGIAVNYERRENVLDNAIVLHLELLAKIIVNLGIGNHDEAEALLPELLADPAWGIAPKQLWQMSLECSQKHISWMQYMEQHEALQPLFTWLADMATRSLIMPVEPLIDMLLGTPTDDEWVFTSPLYETNFSTESFTKTPARYLELLGALQIIRDKLREHSSTEVLKLADFIDYIATQRSLGNTIVNVVGRSSTAKNRINLMTAHKSKGMEFDHVYILGSIDSSWGETVRSRSRLISYPENLPIRPAGDTFDERLRLYYVAMTRARTTLTLTYSTHAENDTTTARASFLSGENWQPSQQMSAPSDEQVQRAAELAWYSPLVDINHESARDMLAPILERYKLSATHLNAFLDVTRGGPSHFLMQNLLRFPQAMSANAAYGSAVHRTLQQAHGHFAATGHSRPIEDILRDFETNLADMRLTTKEFDAYLKRGSDNLARFFAVNYDSFTTAQRSEVSFANQHSMLGSAHLTGSLDLICIDDKTRTMQVTDYKTGKPSHSWKGTTDFEKIKLHKYRQQLLFYKLLVEQSRDYSKYSVDTAVLQFVEPTHAGDIVSLGIDFDSEELERFSRLAQVVYDRIIAFDLPDISSYEQSYKGILAFENDLLGAS